MCSSSAMASMSFRPSVKQSSGQATRPVVKSRGAGAWARRTSSTPWEMTFTPFSRHCAIAFLKPKLGVARMIADLYGNAFTLCLFGQVAEAGGSSPWVRAELLLRARGHLERARPTARGPPLANFDRETARFAAALLHAAFASPIGTSRPASRRSVCPCCATANKRARFLRHTLLPLDDCLYALKASIPHLTRSSLHRWLQRHGISRVPDVDGDKPEKRKFKTYPIGYFHIDVAEVRTEQGKLHRFVAIDRTSKFAFVELHEKATTRVSADFLGRLLAAVPYKVHTVLTDNGIQFTTPGAGGSAVPLIREAMAKGELFRAHAFEYACAKAGIDHRTTRPKHPWTNGQVKRVNRTIKDATVKRFHYDDQEQLRPPHRLHFGLQLWPAPEDAEGSHTL